jgi:large subunit ribosomal protein L29
MKADDIRDLGNEEVAAQLRDLREEQFRLRIRSATQELENPAIIGAIRRDIARMRTILRERELAAEE